MAELIGNQIIQTVKIDVKGGEKLIQVTRQLDGLHVISRKYEDGVLRSTRTTSMFGDTLHRLAGRIVVYQGVYRIFSEVLRRVTDTISDAIKEWQKWNENLEKVNNQLTGETDKTIKKVSERIQTMSFALNENKNVLMEGFLAVKKYGYEINTTEQIVAKATKIAKDSYLETNETIETFVGLMNDYKISITESESIMKKLTNAGWGLADIEKNLSSIIKNINEPTDTQIQLANELGLSYDSLSLKILGLGGTYEYLASKANAKQLQELFGGVENWATATSLTGVPRAPTFNASKVGDVTTPLFPNLSQEQINKLNDWAKNTGIGKYRSSSGMGVETIGGMTSAAYTDEFKKTIDTYLSGTKEYVAEQRTGIELAEQAVAIYKEQLPLLGQQIKEKKELNKIDLESMQINLDQQQVSLAIMRIQLGGFMRRRGLTRSEQKQIKELQYDALSLRIKEAEKTIETSKLMVNIKTREYDIEVTAMQDAYNAMSLRITEYESLVVKAWTNIATATREAITLAREYSPNAPELPYLQESLAASQHALGTPPVGSAGLENLLGRLAPRFLGRHQGGTEYATYTGLHHLERGEKIIAKGKDTNGGNVNIINNISGNNISSEIDIRKLCSAIARASSAGLIHTNITRNRMR